MSHPPRDLTPRPDLLYDAALAGPVRTRRPVYGDQFPPCNAGCPAGENIQAWLASTRAGEHERAWRQLTATNLLPTSHGRACHHHARAPATGPSPTARPRSTRWKIADCLPLGPQPEPRSAGWTSARANGHAGAHQR